jgi:hypothetical protein
MCDKTAVIRDTVKGTSCRMCLSRYGLTVGNNHLRLTIRGLGSSVGIVNGYGLDGPGISRGEIFRTCPDRPWGPPSLLYNWYRVLPRGKERPGRAADPSPPSSAVVMKE